MADNNDLKDWLVRFGYQHCPANVYSNNVPSDSEFRQMDVAELPVANAIRQMQDNYKSTLAFVTNDPIYGLGRDINADGVAGPFTLSVLDMPRCGMPDYFSAHLEEANIPKACRNEIICARNFQAVPNLSAEATERAFQIAANNWNTSVDVTITPAGRDRWTEAICTITLAALQRGVLADQYLARNSCNDNLPGRVSSRIQWYVDYLAAVMSHEWGHLLGLRHIPDGKSLMNPSITQEAVASRGKPAEPDLRQAYSLGYEENSDVPNNWVLDGQLTVVSTESKAIGDMAVDAVSDLLPGTPSLVDGTITIRYSGGKKRFIVGPYPEGV